VAWPAFQAQRCFGGSGLNGEIRIGLIGLTGRPDLVLDSIPNIRSARLAAFALADGAQPVMTGSNADLPPFHKRTRIYKTYQEMFAGEDLDLVACCLPNGRNVHASIAAARKGCHVISGEPFAQDSKSLGALKSAIDGAKVHISTMCEMRASSGVAAMRQAIADGLIGEPVLAFAQKSCRSLVNTTPWMGLDLLDGITYATGLEITQASALQTKGILLKLANGGTGIVSVRVLGAKTRPEESFTRLRVTGTKAVVEMIGAQVKLLTPNDPPKELPLPPSRSSFESFAAFLRGEASHLMTTEETFRVAHTALIADQAIREGRLVRV